MQTFLIWIATRRLSGAKSRFFRLRGDLPYTRETWAAAESRVELARLEMLLRQEQLGWLLQAKARANVRPSSEVRQLPVDAVLGAGHILR